MKEMRINKNFWQLLFLIVGAVVLAACQNTSSNSNGNNAAGGGGNASSNTPTEAYKSLYEAVKSKNTESIKQNMSNMTNEMIVSVAEMQKKTPEEMYKNGLTETTMGDKFPAIRNERVKENMAALEVQNPQGVWEDLPFVKEDGRWKLGVGDLFKGTYKKPAPSTAESEANTNVPQMMPGSNMNTAANMRPGTKPPEMPPAKPGSKP
ncbi:MAG TPA: hypothetical protein VEX64_05825 [Pyrinomonadaceae bacterium]|jgi:hypothetical protein|nr:hypothetical protein [Pyrinomonadaceae bacterium]